MQFGDGPAAVTGDDRCTMSLTTFDASVSYSWDRYKVWILAKKLLDEDVERAINSDGQLTGSNGDPATA